MGRAGRPKSEMPPGLEELEEHGVPGGWQRFWHGQQDHIPLGSSGLLPDLSLEEKEQIENGTVSSRELMDFLQRMEYQYEIASADEELLRNLFYAHCREIAGDNLQLEEQQLDKLYDSWFKDLCRDLRCRERDPEWGMRTPLVSAMDPSSPHHSDLRQQIEHWLEEDPDEAVEFLEKEIFPWMQGREPVVVNISHFPEEEGKFWENLLRIKAPHALSVLDRTLQAWPVNQNSARYRFVWGVIAAENNNDLHQAERGLQAVFRETLSGQILDEELCLWLREIDPTRYADLRPRGLSQRQFEERLGTVLKRLTRSDHAFFWKDLAQGRGDTLGDVLFDYLEANVQDLR